MVAQQGKKPTEDDVFYTNWGQETMKNNITLCNDVLKQLITINSALLGISIIYEYVIANKVLKVFVLLLFFISLVIAIIGILPYENKVELDVPNEIKKHKIKALKHKRCYLWVSAIAILVGFALILVELLFKSLC